VVDQGIGFSVSCEFVHDDEDILMRGSARDGAEHKNVHGNPLEWSVQISTRLQRRFVRSVSPEKLT
jgi:hypothetical protein